MALCVANSSQKWTPRSTYAKRFFPSEEKVSTPIDRVLDDFVKQALMARHPGVARFLPRHVDTVFTKYVVPIDISTKKELDGFIAKLPGFINVGMDGASVNSKQKVSKMHEC